MSSTKQKLPEGWSWALVSQVTVKVPNVSPQDNPKQAFGYIDISSIDNSKFRIVNQKSFLGKDAPSRAKRSIQTGDVLFSNVRTYLRNVAIVSEEWDARLASTGFTVLRSNGVVKHRFLFHYVLSEEFINAVTARQTGTHYPATSDRVVKAQLMRLPPLAEQKRIVDVIEKLFVLISNAKHRLNNAAETMKRFRKSVLNAACTGKLTEDWRERHLGIKPATESLLEIKEERQKKATTKKKQQRIEEIYSENETRIVNDLPLTWKIVRLEKVCESFQYGTSQKSLNSGKIPVLRMGNLQDGRLKWDKLKYSNDDEEIKKYWLEPNTVLFNRTNSPKLVGKTSIFRGEHEAIYAGYLIKINNYRDYLDSMYLNCCMNTEYIRANCLKVKRDGVSQSNINATKLAGFEIALPPFEEQKEIVRRVERLFELADKIESRIKQARDRVDKLTQSILAKAFRGELVPTEAELAQRQGRIYETAEQLLVRIKLEREKKRTIELKGSEIKGRSKVMGVLRGLKKRPILEVLSEAQGKLKPEQLFRKANFTEEFVDDFYEELREAVQAEQIKELRPNKTEIYLEAIKP